MVDVLLDMIQTDVNDALEDEKITFEQAHFVLRQALEKISLYDKSYREKIKDYWQKEKEIKTKIKCRIEELNELRKPLGIPLKEISDELISKLNNEKANNDTDIWKWIKNL